MVYPLGPDQIVLHLHTPTVDGTGAPVRDRYGNPAYTDSDVTVVGSMEVTASEERSTNTVRVRLDGRAMLPPTVPVTFLDGLTWQAIRFEIRGPARPWTGIDGSVDHLEVTCRGYKG